MGIKNKVVEFKNKIVKFYHDKIEYITFVIVNIGLVDGFLNDRWNILAILSFILFFELRYLNLKICSLDHQMRD